MFSNVLFYDRIGVGGDTMSFIKGNFKKYIFKSDSGYIIGLFRVKDCSDDILYKNKTITFTGYFPLLNETDLYVFNGNMVNHTKYGEQFNVVSYEVILPNEKDNVVDFLCSDIFPGIGEKKASKIVEVLGGDCLSVILECPSNLMLVPGVTEKQKNTIYDSLTKYRESYKVIVELTSYGFSMKDALSIYNKYKGKTLSIFSSNPYKLIDDINDITYSKIEKIRHNLNILDDDKNRIKASIKYVFNYVSFSYGSTYMLYEEILFFTKKLLETDNSSLIIDCLSEMITSGDVIKYDEKYFIKSMYDEERYVANRIFNLANNDSSIKIDNILELINELEKLFGICYNSCQVDAIKEAFCNNFLVITGGPGTGKTTIIKAICELYSYINGVSYDEMMDSFVLLAPTGRASKRVAEQTNYTASTIHRFLKWNKDDNTFRVNEENKSDAKVIIVDEVSMVDIHLLYSLFMGIKDNTKVIFIGDFNQLPSVGPGQVLKDIIDSECVNVVKLEKLYRREETSNITLLAHDIIHEDLSMDLFNTSDDLVFIECDSSNMKDKLKEELVKYVDCSYEEFQVMAPIYKGENGIDDLNYFMQDIFNPKDNTKNEMVMDGVLYRECDKVLQLVNMVDDNVFNGDIGCIRLIKNKEKQVYIDFDNNMIKYTPNNFSNIKLGYAISIHKSQGSEFDYVIIPVLNKYNNMLYKKLIYTGITRAKKRLILIGEKDAFMKSVYNNRESNRKTSLKSFILECIK